MNINNKLYASVFLVIINASGLLKKKLKLEKPTQALSRKLAIILLFLKVKLLKASNTPAIGM
jgi:hypothetical protein